MDAPEWVLCGFFGVPGAQEEVLLAMDSLTNFFMVGRPCCGALVYQGCRRTWRWGWAPWRAYCGGAVRPQPRLQRATFVCRAFPGVPGVQEEVVVGMGTLAGSTVMLLTITWGVSLLVGRCDLSPPPNVRAIDGTRSNPWDLWNTGATTDRTTPHNAWIMLASILPMLIVQVRGLPSCIPQQK